MTRADLLTMLERTLAEASPPDCAALLGELERLKALAWVRLNGAAQPLAQPALPDKLLTVTEAADKLSLTTDYLYRHARELPFTVRTGRHVRFSLVGIERYIRQRQGQ